MPTIRPSLTRVRPLLLTLLLLASLPSLARSQNAPSDSECCFYTVVGTLWHDQNNDTVKQGTEPVLPGWTVEVLDVSNTVVGSTTTNGSGAYSFTVPVGCGATFKLRQVVPAGWSQSFPLSNGWHTGFGTGCSGTPYGPYDFGNVQPGCPPFSQTYTTDPEFNLGTLNGVITNSDQLELSPTSTTWPYAWIANASEGTISKVDTQTGNEVARYFTGPPDGGNGYGYLYPSRTVVDKDGHCWVANRSMWNGPASVTQIVTSGGIDWNNDSSINTSWDANSNGMIEPGEMLPWGQDERVIRHYELGASGEGARGMVLDKMGFLWVGLTNAQTVVKVDPTLPTATYSANNFPSAPPVLASIYVADIPYGLALSPNGLIYMSSVGPKAYQLDPGLASGGTGAGPAVTEYINHGGGNYGIAVDQDCKVWLALYSHPNGIDFGCVRWDPPLTAGNPLNGWTISVPGAPGPGRGITVDFNNNIWMACNDVNSSVVRFNNLVTPTVSGVFPTLAPYPIGVGAGSDGNIIVTPGAASNWCKVNSVTGAVMPLAGPELAGLGPYTYSDFTGSQQNMTGLQQGTWTVITDSGSNQFVWNFVGWNSLTPPSTSVQVEARSAQTIPALNSQTWLTISIPGPQAPMVGRYIETRTRLQRMTECGQPFVTPVLYDLTVAGICVPCGFENCPPDTVIECNFPGGAEFTFTPPDLSITCDSTYVVTCSPNGPTFPMGTTTVTCIAVNASDDTVRCQFNVTVIGDCDPDPTGACCLRSFCYETTEADCRMNGGIYFGDNTNCLNGCNQNCAHPPNNLVAWWPMNGATSGVTPNLAGAATGGTLVNGPTPVPAQKVMNSYNFNGTNQYIQVPHHASLDLGSSDFSVDAWIRTTDASGVSTILDKRSSGNIQGFAFFLFDGYPSLQLAVGNVWSNYILTNANGGPPAFVADNAWHLVAATVDRDDPAGVQFYVDGAPVGTPFNPTNRQGSLNNTDPIYMAQRHPALGGGFFSGDMDEVEITRRELSAKEISDLFQADAAGKCPETCYATQNAVCCNGLASNSSITICNYDLVPHTYSWGLTPQNGGAGCAAFGPTGYTPNNGSLVVPAQSCVTIPVQITCPTSVPPGQSSCYNVQIFNHDTGRLFGCQGSVRRALKWCWKWIEIGDPVGVGIVGIPTGIARTLQFEVENTGDGGAGTPPEMLSYMIRPLAGDTGLPSAAVSLNGLPPGEPYIGEISLHGGETGIVSVEVTYPNDYPIGYDRLVAYGDENADGLLEVIGEVAVRSLPSGVSAVPGEPVVPPGTVTDERLLLVFPNPFSANDAIRFRVDGDRPASVKLRLFDLMGRAVKTFYYEQDLMPGEHSVRWTAVDDRGERLRAGIYFLRLDIGKKTESVKLMVRP